MTNKNLSSVIEPLLLRPVGKDYLWGGTRLNDDFGKNIKMTPLAETWECSTHPEGRSIVAEGKFKGASLAAVLKQHPEYLGKRYQGSGEIPILIKLIDAKQDLSVQVHPDDEYAASHENGQRGKTEMWYVIDALKGTQLVYGFKTAISRKQLEKGIEEGCIEKYLQKVPVHKDDVFFIKAGTVHAIGAGALIAEIQECSNLTYRLYDYNRVDKEGKRRELHVEKALDVADRRASDTPRQPFRILKYKRGYASELLCRCRYFQVERVLINTENNRDLVEIDTDEITFRVLLCIGGCGILTDKKEMNLIYFKGDCIFIPANTGKLYLHGYAQLLNVIC